MRSRAGHRRRSATRPSLLRETFQGAQQAITQSRSATRPSSSPSSKRRVASAPLQAEPASLLRRFRLKRRGARRPRYSPRGAPPACALVSACGAARSPEERAAAARPPPPPPGLARSCRRALLRPLCPLLASPCGALLRAAPAAGPLQASQQIARTDQENCLTAAPDQRASKGKFGETSDTPASASLLRRFRLKRRSARRPRYSPRGAPPVVV